MDNNLDEKYLLSIIYNHNNLINELQINEKILTDQRNQRILLAMKKVYQKNKVIDPTSLADELPDLIDYLTLEIITNDYYLDVQYETQFVSCQKRILDNYKIKLYDKLNTDLSRKVISMEEYNIKSEKINKLNIFNKINYLTKEEITSNIYIKNKGIKFDNYPILTRLLKLFQNDFLIIGAATGVGKSGFMLNLLNDLSKNYQCLYFNIEMSKSTIYRRLIAINKNIPVNSIDDPSDYQKQLINESFKELEERKIIIESQVNNIQDIKMIISKAKDKNKHTIIFIDHIGLLTTNTNKNLYEQLTYISKELRTICFDFNCTVIAASQLNRSSYSEDNPTINMLKDSGELENSSRKVIILYKDKEKTRDELKPVMKVSIQKNDTGMLGNINMEYYKINQTFKEINNYDQGN